MYDSYTWELYIEAPITSDLWFALWYVQFDNLYIRLSQYTMWSESLTTQLKEFLTEA